MMYSPQGAQAEAPGMTLGQIKARVMFQANQDLEDLGDFMPALDGYVNAGYDLLLYAWARRHLGDDYMPLWLDEETPRVPGWTHPALADYATWLVYRNGNPQRQQRGMQYLAAFQEVVARLAAQGGAGGGRDRFIGWW